MTDKKELSQAERLEQINQRYGAQRILAILVAIVVGLILMIYLLWTPITGPWQQSRIGDANYRQAKQERRITVAEAQGELDAAQAQADAIRTLGEASRKYPEYRSQIFIAAFGEALTTGTIQEVIYVPQGIALPATEASRFSGK